MERFFVAKYGIGYYFGNAKCSFDSGLRVLRKLALVFEVLMSSLLLKPIT